MGKEGNKVMVNGLVNPVLPIRPGQVQRWKIVNASKGWYEAGATGLNACFPPWAHDGGPQALRARLSDPTQRARIRDEMSRPGAGWENLYDAAGGAEGILLVSFKTDALKPLTGLTLAEVARRRSADPRDVAMDLVRDDESRVGMIVFMDIWNDFMWPLIVINSPAKMTLPLMLNLFRGLYSTSWTTLMPAAVMVLAPVVIVYLVNQRFITRGFVMSGLKG